VVAAIDWTTLGPALELQGKDAFVAEVKESGGAAVKIPGEAGAGEWLAELRGAPASDRFDRLLAFVSGQAKVVFGVAPGEPLDAHRGLFEMGMNSLMSVQLKRRLEAGLGLKLPGTLTLNYPNVTALASFLQAKLFAETQAMPSAAAPPNQEFHPAVADLASVAGMSESETDAALAAELAVIQQKLGVH
jgi:acyl carrier protein